MRWIALREFAFDLNHTGQPLEPCLERSRQELLWADHVIIVYPVWWGTMPALLKGWLDRVLLPGFAFEEREDGGWGGLLGGRSATLIATMDTPRWIFGGMLHSCSIRALRDATLRFCGVGPVRVRIFSPVRTSTPELRKRWLEQARQEGFELEKILLTGWRPRLRTWLPDGMSRRVLYLKVTGVGESDIVEAVEKQLEAIPGLDLGYCIRNGDVDVRLAGPQVVVDEAAGIVRAALGDCIVSEDRRIIEEVIVQMLSERGEWLATAESCTGGTIANRITDVSGASRVFGHGWVTYANEAKHQHLGVPLELIETHGAVSEEVARAMAEGALKNSGADYALSVTGIAGPFSVIHSSGTGTSVSLPSRQWSYLRGSSSASGVSTVSVRPTARFSS